MCIRHLDLVPSSCTKYMYSKGIALLKTNSRYYELEMCFCYLNVMEYKNWSGVQFERIRPTKKCSFSSPQISHSIRMMMAQSISNTSKSWNNTKKVVSLFGRALSFKWWFATYCDLTIFVTSRYVEQPSVCITNWNESFCKYWEKFLNVSNVSNDVRVFKSNLTVQFASYMERNSPSKVMTIHLVNLKLVVSKDSRWIWVLGSRFVRIAINLNHDLNNLLDCWFKIGSHKCECIIPFFGDAHFAQLMICNISWLGHFCHT